MSVGIALGIIAALVLIGLTAGFALSRRRARPVAPEPELRPEPRDFGRDRFGEVGTVIQFSTVYCTRCPATRRLIAETTQDRPGIDVIHVDVTHTPRLAAAYRLTQTPTVLLLDRAGVPRTRFSGILTRTALVDGLDALTRGGTP